MESFREILLLFNIAFGASVQEFLNLLAMPHEFIFNRQYYMSGKGKPVLDEFRTMWNQLSSTQRGELIQTLSGPEEQKGLKPSRFRESISNYNLHPKVCNIMKFYTIYGYAKSVDTNRLFNHRDLFVPEDHKVEDAGLYENEEMNSSTDC